MIKDQRTAPADMTTHKVGARRGLGLFLWGDADRLSVVSTLNSVLISVQ